MDFDALERLWRSETNNRTTVAEAYVMAATLKVLKGRRAAVRTGLILIGLALIIWTGAIIYALAAGKITSLAREWGIVAMLGISWLTYLWALRQQQRHVSAYPDLSVSMPDTLRALIDENRTAQARTRMMGVALIVFVGVLGVCLWQLHAVGKMELRHVVQGSVLFGGALGLSAIIHAIKYVRLLRPEGERLRRLLSEYETPE